MIKKKLLLCCVMSIVLSACGTNSEAAPKEDNSPITMEESVTEKPTENEEGTVSTDATETVQASDDIQEPVRLPSGCTAYDGEDIYYTEDYSYDSEGRLTSIVRTYNGQEPIITFEASYDEKGNRTHEKIVYIREQNKSVDYMEISDYVFDEKGSWIERNIKGNDDGDVTKVIVNNTYEGDKLVLKDRGNGAYVEYAYDDIGGHTEYHYDNDSFYLEKVFDSSDRLLLNEFKMDNFKRVEKFEYDEHGNLTSIYKANYFDEDYSIENTYDENGVLISAYYTSHNSLPNLKLDYKYEDYAVAKEEDTKDDPFAQYSDFKNCTLKKGNEFRNGLAWIDFIDNDSGKAYSGCINEQGKLVFYMDTLIESPVPFGDSGRSIVRKDNKTFYIDKEGNVNKANEVEGTCLIQSDYALYRNTVTGFDVNKTTYQIFDPEGNKVIEFDDKSDKPVMFYNYHGNGIFSFFRDNQKETDGEIVYSKNNTTLTQVVNESLAMSQQYSGKYFLYYIGEVDGKRILTISDDMGNWKDITIPNELTSDVTYEDGSENYILLRNGKESYYIYNIEKDTFKKLDGKYSDRLYWHGTPKDAFQKASCSDYAIAILLKGEDGEAYVGVYDTDKMELLCNPIKGEDAEVINDKVIVHPELTGSSIVEVFDLSGNSLHVFPGDSSFKFSEGKYCINSSNSVWYCDEQFNDLYTSGIDYSGARFVNLDNK